MEKDLISIIVPVYNVRNYLEDCLKSLINQTYKNIEIILVNDGSTDSSSEICLKYKELDSRIIYIYKQNGGLSSARNAGIDMAKGKYISFVDSDDYISSTFIEELWNLIIKNNSDIAFADYCKITENDICSTDKEIFNKNNEQNTYSNVECIKNMYKNIEHGFEFVAWGKLYLRELFEKNNIRYPNGKIHEDTFTTYKLLYYANNICFTNKQLYFYRVRSGSIMTSSFSLKKINKIEAIIENIEFYNANNEIELLNLALNDLFLVGKSFLIELKLKSKDENKKDLCKNLNNEIKKNFKKYVRKSHYSNLKTIYYFIVYYIIYPLYIG